MACTLPRDKEYNLGYFCLLANESKICVELVNFFKVIATSTQKPCINDKHNLKQVLTKGYYELSFMFETM